MKGVENGPLLIPSGEWTDLGAVVVWQETGHPVQVKVSDRYFILPADCEWRVAT